MAANAFKELGINPSFSQGESPEEEMSSPSSRDNLPDNFPLPYFHIQIILYPTADGYVASVSGRLYEQAQLSRLRLGPGYFFQAITWEKDLLVGLPQKKAKEMLMEQVKTLVADFAQNLPSEKNTNGNK